VETLVKQSSNEGDTVIDPFMGTGTTAVACKNLKRKFIGFEIDAERFEKIYARINSNIMSFEIDE
jgi:DNA modification methylase